MLEVAIDLGKEIIKQYLLDSYRDYLKHSYAAAPVQSDRIQIPENKNTKFSLLMWKNNNNKSLVESTEDSQLKSELGIILVN